MSDRPGEETPDQLLTERPIEDRLPRAARAAQTLSEALWEALHEELTDPRGRRVAELSKRLAQVTAAVASLARADAERPSRTVALSSSGSGGEARDRPWSSEPPVAPASVDPRVQRVSDDEPSPSSLSSRQPPDVQEPQWVAAVLVDELAEQESEIEIRDERREESHPERVGDDGGPSAWVASIGRRLERYERDGVPFAVLLVELADVDRLRHAELPGEVARLTGLIETALAGELRPADSLTRERPGRYWLLAPATDSASARTLAERLAGAARGVASHRGAPLQVAVGIATCPADGTQAAALAAHADIALYAARAAGRPVA